MWEVKRIFNEKYRDCDVAHLQDYSSGKYKLGKIDTPIVYSVDCIFRKHPERGGRRCDEFIFYNLAEGKTGIDLIEIKDSETINIDKVRDQLQGGAKFIEGFLSKDPATDGQPFDFRPFCISKGIKPSERAKLIKCKIYIDSRSRYIRQVNFNRTLR